VLDALIQKGGDAMGELVFVRSYTWIYIWLLALAFSKAVSIL
jgi:hypothetical protein